MSKILLSQEVKRVQNELRRLSSLLRKPNKFKMTLSKEGADTVATLEKWIQDNIDLIGSFKEDDVDGNLDVNKSVIANLSVAVSNITAILDREKTYATQADLLRALTEAKAYTDTEVATLKKEVDTIKSAGIHIPHFTSEANRDRAIPNPVDGQTCYVGANGAWYLNIYENGAWVKGILSQHSTTGVDPSKADINLSNVNLGANNSGKILRIKADGTLEFIEPIQIFNGQVLSFAEQKTTGAFADRTLFSEKAITITSGGITPLLFEVTESTGRNATEGTRVYPNIVSTINKIGDVTTLVDNRVDVVGVGHELKGKFIIKLSETTGATDTGIKYQYTALKDITFAEMGK